MQGLAMVLNHFFQRNIDVFTDPSPLAQVDILLAGYPCVCLSSLNTNPQPFEDAESATGSGYHSVMKYIERFRPPMVGLENVRQMLQKRKEDRGARPIDVQNKRMTQYGYECCYILANTCEYGLPQSRNRVWMLYIRKDQLKTNSATMVADMKSFGRHLT